MAIFKIDKVKVITRAFENFVQLNVVNPNTGFNMGRIMVQDDTINHVITGLGEDYIKGLKKKKVDMEIQFNEIAGKIKLLQNHKSDSISEAKKNSTDKKALKGEIIQINTQFQTSYKQLLLQKDELKKNIITIQKEIKDFLSYDFLADKKSPYYIKMRIGKKNVF